ncbi:MAG: hypothetical protein ABIY55_20130 [Kofleriaceae bacterium]
MANRLVLLLLLGGTVGTVGTLGACGKQIGDACNFSQDCSPNGDRLCDPTPSSPGGYCTVLGCDYSTCSSEAVCVQFFTGTFSNRPCLSDAANQAVCTVDGLPPTAPPAPTNEAFDEVCALSGYCVSRASEVRYCMLKCGSDGDCRDGYECRTRDLMIDHGGQPVVAPGVDVSQDPQKFCAAKPPTST